ncbi:ras and EF-hand domain-containing protein homolog isoform X3 [Acropora millepora]|uniref:ras and EF-hand domain-containing protein homolog isoform X3 n=1 Tax=Acropora millepora TaxID=45264 RepID=UPI001CF1BFE5|nr:ras and EF-hand domain-containing protein homolog isoform X3 [Acropora millepora]
MASLETVRPGDLFGTVDLDGSGYIDREELAAVCDLDAKDLAEVFDKLDADKDGRISIEEFSENFRKFRSVVSGVKRKKSEQPSDADVDYEDLKEKLGRSYSLLSGQEYVSELFHYLHNSGDSPQLLALLESFLFSVIRDVKHYSSENERLEEALKRTCEKHTEHMDQLDNEMEQQMQRLESRIRKEEKSKQERANVDIVWQLENKNKEIQTLNARVQKLEGRLKRKEPEEQKIKEEVDEKVQEIRFLRSQLTDAQTNLAVLRSELAQLRNDYEEQETQLTAEKATVMECVQEQESLTRQLQLLHEANKKLHDTNDDLRSALERTRLPDRRSPSPNKRHSISTLYSPTSSFTRNTKSSGNRSSPAFADDSVDGGRSGHTSPSRRLPSSTPLPLSSTNSRRGSLLPSQQSCEVDDESLVNENSLMTELTQAQQLSSLQKDLIDYEDDDTYSSMKPSQRQTFSKQLEILHKTNERLCSSNDDLRAALEALTGRRPFSLKSKSRRNSEKCQRNPSVHSDYGSISSRSITPNHFQGPKSEYDVGDGAEADELSGYDPESDATTMTTDSPPESDNGKPDAQLSAELEAQFKSVIEEDDEDIDEDDVGDEELAKLVAMASALTESEGETDTETEAPEGERVPAVGSDSISEASSNAPVKVTASEGADPERMYKLVLAGDAAVGKSSFILRLCRNKFHNALNSTLGVDFQTKTLCVDGKTIAFQLWDTAGQERFRSIAKSYFRKADGVLLLYDVTCETSFLDVRDWVEAIEESTPTPIPIMMCGNKIDLRQSFLDEGKTVITQESGEKLAKEYGALFLEISSKENTNITEACVELGRLLRNIEDTEVKESSGLKLTEGDSKNKKKPNCCPV